MWIRSQSRKALLNVNQVVIIPSVDKRMYFICNSLEKESVTLGVYLTEEKALKVLDRIEELIENQCGLTFYMPADEEVVTVKKRVDYAEFCELEEQEMKMTGRECKNCEYSEVHPNKAPCMNCKRNSVYTFLRILGEDNFKESANE